MLRAMATQTKPNPKLARLRRQLKAHGITQLAVAEAAGATPPHVCNVLAGRDKSRKVVEAAKRLLADRQNGAQEPGKDRPTRETPETAGAS